MYHIISAKDIPRYTMYYNEVIKLYKIRMIFLKKSKTFIRYQSMYLFIFSPIISVNIVGIVFPNCFHCALLFPHSLKSESNP